MQFAENGIAYVASIAEPVNILDSISFLFNLFSVNKTLVFVYCTSEEGPTWNWLKQYDNDKKNMLSKLELNSFVFIITLWKC